MAELHARSAGSRACVGPMALVMILLCLLILAAVAAAPPTLPSSAIGYAKVVRACAPPNPGSATCFALARQEAKEAREVTEREEAAVAKKHEEEAAVAKKHEEEAAVAKRHEEEAAVAKRHEEEAAASVKAAANLGAQGVSGFQMALAPAVPDTQLVGTSLQVGPFGAVTVKISCPSNESECSGSVTLRTLNAVIASAKHGARQKPSVLTLSAGYFTVAGGQVRAVTLHLSKSARVLLARTRTLRARATLGAHDLQGASHTTRTTVTLHVATARHHGG